MRTIQASIVGVGFVLLLFLSDKSIQAIDYTNWIEVKVELDYALLQNASAPSRDGWSPSYVRARYHYSVDGIPYTGYSVLPLEHVFLPKESVQSLKPGKIMIFHNPESTENSFIYVDYPTSQLLMLGMVASLLIMLGVFFKTLFRFVSVYFGLRS